MSYVRRAAKWFRCSYHEVLEKYTPTEIYRACSASLGEQRGEQTLLDLQRAQNP